MSTCAVGVLTVRQTKFNKSRRLPMHPSAVRALCDYRRVRDRTVARNADRPFFVSPAGCVLPSRTVHGVFAQLRDRLRWVARGGHPRPRIHDLRHAFAVRRVRLWHQSGVTMDHGMLLLCTYLGHAKISDTYWYLTGVPELMAVVGSEVRAFRLGAGGEACVDPPPLRSRRWSRSSSPSTSSSSARSVHGRWRPTATPSRCCWASLSNVWASRPRPCSSPTSIANCSPSFLDHLERDRHNSVRSPQCSSGCGPFVPEVRRSA